MLYSSDAKDPNVSSGFELNWAPHLGGATISTSSWTVPSGITNTGTSFTTTSTAIGLSGGTLGRVYRLVNLVAFVGGGTEEWTLDIRDEEPVVVPVGPPFATVGEAQDYQEDAQGENAMKVGMVLEDASNMVARLAPQPPRVTTTLSASVTTSQDTLPLTDASKFPDTGTLRIDNELVIYLGRTNPDGDPYVPLVSIGSLNQVTTGAPGVLTGVVRGRRTTIPATHASAATVEDVDYPLRARRAELAAFEWLWATRAWRPTQTGPVGSESYSIEEASIKTVIRQIMGRHYSGAAGNPVPVRSVFGRPRARPVNLGYS